MKNKRVGSHFDDFLKEENFLAETECTAIKRVIVYQIKKIMKKKRITKVKMAAMMHTSRSAVDRLLEPNNDSVTLLTLGRAAKAIGKNLKFELV